MRHPGDAQPFERHAFKAVGHRGLINSSKTQAALAQQQIHRAAQKRPGAIGQQRHTGIAFQVEQRLAIGIGRAHREHFGITQVQGRENFRIHLQGRIRIVKSQHQIAAAFAQSMHGVSDVSRNQPCGDVQPFIAQLGDPAREKSQCQGVRRSHLHDLALPAFEVMQVTQHLTQLLDHGARRDQKQLTGRSQLHRGAGTIHQGQPQRRFQAANTPTEGRLSDEATLCSLGKTASRSQGTEVLQPFTFEIHRVLPDAHQNGSHARRACRVTSLLCRLCIG